jgi:hypothetical protein
MSRPDRSRTFRVLQRAPHGRLHSPQSRSRSLHLLRSLTFTPICLIDLSRTNEPSTQSGSPPKTIPKTSHFSSSTSDPSGKVLHRHIHSKRSSNTSPVYVRCKQVPNLNSDIALLTDGRWKHRRDIAVRERREEVAVKTMRDLANDRRSNGRAIEEKWGSWITAETIERMAAN